MNKEITAEDIIKAIDEMFDDEKMQESETFRQGYNYGILKASQYLVHIQQELQRKDNIINELKKWLNEFETEEFNYNFLVVRVKDILDKIKDIENDL